jgi:uncharacterized protein (TIGR02246 family)
MKRIARSLSVLFLAGFAAFAHASECSSLASMRWLLGDWLADGDKSTWRETWTEIDPDTWEGRGIEIAKAEPGKESAEELRLVEMGGSVFYLAKVTHNELPIPFRLVECGDDRLVFANPAHDFPRRLDYQRLRNGRLQVRVSDGADKGFTLDFGRQPTVSADYAAVLAAEDARFVAMVTADPEAMRRYFAEDVAYVHSTGRVVNREQLIDEMQAGKLRYLALTPSERHVAFMGPDDAFVRGQVQIAASADSKTVEFQARYLAIYARDDGDWRLRAWQSLRLP